VTKRARFVTGRRAASCAALSCTPRAPGAAGADALAYAVAGRVVLLARYGGSLASVVCGRHGYGVHVHLGSREKTEVGGWRLRPIEHAICTCPSWRPICKHILSSWVVGHYVGLNEGQRHAGP